MKKIKAIIMDVDGTLTNGQINIGSNGELFKSFYCRDGLGILMVLGRGVIPVILTSRISDIVQQRSEELGITHILQGCKDEKESILEKFMAEQKIKYDDAAYIGDDINDLFCMRKIKNAGGIVGCPADAVNEVKKIADIIAEKNGGYGAVRDFIEKLFEKDMIP